MSKAHKIKIRISGVSRISRRGRPKGGQREAKGGAKGGGQMGASLVIHYFTMLQYYSRAIYEKSVSARACVSVYVRACMYACMGA